MNEETLAQLFKPFAQGELGASRGAGGTGLGLVICARLCDMMGGRIAAESVPGVGSAFRVTIPLAKPPVDSRAPPCPQSRAGWCSSCPWSRKLARSWTVGLTAEAGRDTR